MDGLKSVRNLGVVGDARRQAVYAEWERCGHALPPDVISDQTMVILQLPSDDETVVVGNLAEIGPHHIAFDYLVTNKTLEDRLHVNGGVLLRRDHPIRVSLAQIP